MSINVPQRIALVGTCPSSRMLAPYADRDVEIWACGPDNAGGQLPRVSRWFEIHGDLGFSDAPPWEATYVNWLNQQAQALAFTLVVQDHRLFPKAIMLPKDELIAKFGRLFFTSTPAWMMALAIHMGVKEIGLFGLDMSSRHEYLLQRPGMHHFIELAEQRYGVSVYAPIESDILQPAPLYGYNYSTPFGRKLRVRRLELEARIADVDRQMEQLKHDRAYLSGALDDIDYQETIWTGDRDPALAKPERMASPDLKIVGD